MKINAYCNFDVSSDIDYIKGLDHRVLDIKAPNCPPDGHPFESEEELSEFINEWKLKECPLCATDLFVCLHTRGEYKTVEDLFK